MIFTAPPNDHLWRVHLEWEGVGQKLLFFPDEIAQLLAVCPGPSALSSSGAREKNRISGLTPGHLVESDAQQEPQVEFVRKLFSMWYIHRVFSLKRDVRNLEVV